MLYVVVGVEGVRQSLMGPDPAPCSPLPIQQHSAQLSWGCQAGGMSVRNSRQKLTLADLHSIDINIVSQVYFHQFLMR